MHDPGPPIVRHIQSREDWIQIRELACETGRGGNPILLREKPFFSDLWIGPYETFFPEWTYVLEQNNQIIGYLTGCPQTKLIEFKKRFLFYPKLLIRLLFRKYPRSPVSEDAKRFINHYRGIEKKPDSYFSSPTQEKIKSQYPAHLHINLLTAYRGSGWGALLLEKFSSELKQVSARGVHILCGEGPVDFYKKNGFSVLEETLNVSNCRIFALGKSLEVD